MGSHRPFLGGDAHLVTALCIEGQHTAGAVISRELELVAEEGAEVTLVAKYNYTPVLSLIGGAELSAAGLWVTGGSQGFILGADAVAIITESTFSKNTRGIELFGFALAAITRTTISGNGAGIGAWQWAQANVTSSTISQNSFGIVLTDSSQATIARSTLSDNNDNGVMLGAFAQATITRCTISRNWGGIRSYGSVIVSGSTISENRYGVSSAISRGASASIAGCIVSRNTKFGIYLGAGSASITGCTISENGEDGILLGFYGRRDEVGAARHGAIINCASDGP